MKTPSTSEQIFKHAMRYVYPFASQPGHTWVALPTGNLTHEACSVASDRFLEWLAHSFQSEHGIFPSRHSLLHAVRMVQAQARFADRPREEVFTRIGWLGDPLRPRAITIDLANANHERVEITRKNWRVHSNDGWRFRTNPGSRPLPKPRRHSTPPLQALESLLNLPDPNAFRRLLAWTLAALRPTGPYPLLILTGPPSSGKSTIARILRNLIDPSITPLHTLPKSEHDLFFQAIHNRVLAFDHVPHIPRAISTALTRIASGTAFAAQGPKPYDQSLQFGIERPVIITVPSADSAAIDWVRSRTIANLAMTVQLPSIAPHRMRSSTDLATELDIATPYILADLCNAISAALSGSTGIPEWLASAAIAIGQTVEDMHATLNPDPLIRALTAHLEQNGPWAGTATELYSILEARAPEAIPADPRCLSSQLNQSPLAIFGIEISHHRTESERRLKLNLTQPAFSASFEPEISVMN